MTHHPHLRAIPTLPAATRRWTHPGLSTSEVNVLRMLVYFGNKPAVCARLYVENSTVSTTLSRIRAKYRAAGRPADNQITLATRAYQDGLITLEEADAAEPPATWVGKRPPAPGQAPTPVGGPGERRSA